MVSSKRIGKILAACGCAFAMGLSLTSCKDAKENYIFEIEKKKGIINTTDFKRYNSTNPKFNINGEEYSIRISDKHGQNWDTPSCEYIGLYDKDGKRLALSDRIPGGNLEDIIIKETNEKDNKVEFWVTQRIGTHEKEYIIHEGELYFK